MTLRLASRCFWCGVGAIVGSALASLAWPTALVGVIAAAQVLTIAAAWTHGYLACDAEIRACVRVAQEYESRRGRDAVKSRSARPSDN